MDEHAKSIWGGFSARDIMREARRRFRKAGKEDLPGAYVALASVHYSLVKRYRGGLGSLLFLAAWHMWRAAVNVNRAVDLLHSPGGRIDYGRLTSDQIDIVTTIWSKVPKWLGNYPERTKFLVTYALDRDRDVMKPHTRALMLITLGELEALAGDWQSLRKRIEEAESLIRLVRNESSGDREQQLVRILFKIGVYYLERHSGPTSFTRATDYLDEALSLADRVSKDQAVKIRAFRYVR